MRFITRVLLLQLLVVAVVTAMFTTILTLVTVTHLQSEARATALAIARTVAADPDVRAAVAEVDDGEDGDAAVVEKLQSRAEETTRRTGALFVVITDADGVRLAHPTPERVGERVSTDHRPALRGEEITAWETGTLGGSARAKVPVHASGGDRPVGMVSVGFERDSVYRNLRSRLLVTGLAALAALLIGAAAALVFRSRWERSTLGLQPEELVALLQNQEAVLNGVGDGVIAVDGDGVIRLANRVAEELLGGGPLTGRPVSELPLGPGRDRSEGRVVGDRVLYLDTRPVRHEGRDLGEVIVLRDRTDVVDLAQRLDSVRAMTSALRVQRHEFANRIHVASGLLDAGRTDDAREFLDTLRQRGPVDYPLQGAELLDDPFLRSFLGLKSMEAAERGVAVRVGEETLLLGTVTDPEDTATVLGNLVDNAVTAAAHGGEPKWVEVTALQAGADLVLTVADSGPGLTPDDAPRTREDDNERVHGHGIGLALSRELVERRGGRLWVIDDGRAGPVGAVFGVQLPDVLTPTKEEE